jgi:hypothetical protein
MPDAEIAAKFSPGKNSTYFVKHPSATKQAPQKKQSEGPSVFDILR